MIPLRRKVARGRAEAEKAFSLLEVLVAMFVLGMSISSLFVLMSRSLSNVERTEAVNRAGELAQSKLNEILVSHRASGDPDAAQLELGNPLAGQWDELTRWEATASRVEGRIEERVTPTTPVQILFTVYWKRNPGGRESSMRFETTQLWMSEEAQ